MVQIDDFLNLPSNPMEKILTKNLREFLIVIASSLISLRSLFFLHPFLTGKGKIVI